MNQPRANENEMLSVSMTLDGGSVALTGTIRQILGHIIHHPHGNAGEMSSRYGSLNLNADLMKFHQLLSPRAGV